MRLNERGVRRREMPFHLLACRILDSLDHPLELLGSELNFFEWNDPNCDAFRVACRTRTRRKKQEHARQSGGECPAQSAVCSVGFHITLPVYWLGARSEERRVGKECVSMCRSRW